LTVAVRRYLLEEGACRTASDFSTPVQACHACREEGSCVMTGLASAGGDTSADYEVTGGGQTVAPVPYLLGDRPGPLSRDELGWLDAWWRAANYLAVGQIYLMANPLLRESLLPEHIKPRLLGHFGTVPGLNMVWAHANRQIIRRGLDAVFVAGPGHGGPGPNACAWLEGAGNPRLLP
jgi:xylulose-5-phosphate/fructose-6-phosphate phosphoketolase